jgi:hypothetical protein
MFLQPVIKMNAPKMISGMYWLLATWQKHIMEITWKG